MRNVRSTPKRGLESVLTSFNNASRRRSVISEPPQQAII